MLAMRTALVNIVVLMLATGCVGSKADPKGRPGQIDTGPVVDSAPYWCWYVPQQAIKRTTGLSISLAESRDGVWPTHGGCSLRNEYDRLGMEWSVRGGDEVMGYAHKNFDEVRLASLPEDLGEGLIAYTGDPPSTHPYYGISWFRCGKKSPWISIELSEVAKGRNVVNDMTQLLRIAQQRYGKLHKCDPKPR